MNSSHLQQEGSASTPSAGQSRVDASRLETNVIAVVSRAGVVALVRAQDGAVIWQRTVGGDVREVAAGSGLLLAATGPASDPSQDTPASASPSVLTALHLNDGAVAWQLAPDHHWHDTLQVHIGGQRAFATDGGDGTIFALDLATGQVVWENHNDPGQSFRLRAVTADTVYIWENDPVSPKGYPDFLPHLTALDAATGQRRWHYHHPIVRLHLLDDRSVVLVVSPPAAPPPNTERQLHLATLDAATGAEQRTCDIPPGGFSFLATQGMTLYVLYARSRRDGESSTLVAYSLVDGHVLWSMTTGHVNRDGQYYRPRYIYAWQGVIMEGRLYIHEVLEPDYTVEVQAYDLMTRTPAWTWQSPSGLWHNHMDPVLCGGNGHLYLTTNQGLFALSASTGKLIWRTAIEHDFSCREPIFIG